MHIAEIGLLLAFVVWSECVFVSRDSFCSMVADAILMHVVANGGSACFYLDLV